jgi:hypothetical protein
VRNLHEPHKVNDTFENWEDERMTEGDVYCIA